jgi:hypothetical protein
MGYDPRFIDPSSSHLGVRAGLMGTFECSEKRCAAEPSKDRRGQNMYPSSRALIALLGRRIWALSPPVDDIE